MLLLVTVNTLPLIVHVIGTVTVVLLLFTSSIQPVPFVIASLKVTLITLLIATFTALFAGSTTVTVGGVLTVIGVETE